MITSKEKKMKLKLLVLVACLVNISVPAAFAQEQTPRLDTKDRFVPVIGRNGMVSSREKMASQVGVDILKAGGNAVDAAVAVGFAMAVTYPQAGNIGGGGFMVIRTANGEVTTIDFRETAPAKASRDMFLDDDGNVIP
ncbi:MAG: gamma-glutamyltransferase, partial [Kordiimonadaceae bacterium]|nr:gamma-glutamyltransferase [Kordiimonadaceae bacterium]